jgi:hypothetical protein
MIRLNPSLTNVELYFTDGDGQVGCTTTSAHRVLFGGNRGGMNARTLHTTPCCLDFIISGGGLRDRESATGRARAPMITCESADRADRQQRCMK